QTFVSPLMCAAGDNEDIVVDVSDVSTFPVRSIGASFACVHRTSVRCGRSRQPSSMGVWLSEPHLQGRPGTRKGSRRNPPRYLLLQPSSRRPRRLSFSATTVCLSPTAVQEINSSAYGAS